MSNENKRPWYRNPAWLAIIASIAAAIITSPIWVHIIFPPPSDFNLVINPMQGAVQQGGVITTEITVKGIHGYEQPVSLSATGQPSGVVIAFVPPFGEAKSSYTSSVTINVNQNVIADDYRIIIKGTGADGKEHTCSYTLTVKPSVAPTPIPTVMPTPTPTHTETPPSTTTPTPTPIIQITNLNDGDYVPWHYTVKGTSNIKPNSDLNIYVLIHADKWYAQPKAYIFPDRGGEWETESPVRFGRPEDSGKGYTYDVCAIVTTQDFEVDKSFTDIPDYNAKSKIITVTRE